MANVGIWCVHHMHSALDRAGKANASRFRYITHQQLTAIVGHELGNNNARWASGRVWVRMNCIPWGDHSVPKGQICIRSGRCTSTTASSGSWEHSLFLLKGFRCGKGGGGRWPCVSSVTTCYAGNGEMCPLHSASHANQKMHHCCQSKNLVEKTRDVERDNVYIMGVTTRPYC